MDIEKCIMSCRISVVQQILIGISIRQRGEGDGHPWQRRKMHMENFVGMSKGKRPFERRKRKKKIWILKKQDMRACAGFIWLRLGFRGGLM